MQRTVRSYFHDLSSHALSFNSQFFCIEASTKENVACLWKIFGTGWGYGVRRARVTKASGAANLSVNEHINVIDFVSVPDAHSISINDDEAPKLENKVLFYLQYAHVTAHGPILLSVCSSK